MGKGVAMGAQAEIKAEPALKNHVFTTLVSDPGVANTPGYRLYR